MVCAFFWSFRFSKIVTWSGCTGVDPPDAVPRPKVRAKLEAWYDPAAATPMRSAKKIAAELQQNYAKWQPRAKYVTFLLLLYLLDMKNDHFCIWLVNLKEKILNLKF